MDELKNLWGTFLLRKQLKLDSLEFPHYNKRTPEELLEYKKRMSLAHFERDFPSEPATLEIVHKDDFIIYNFKNMPRMSGKTTLLIKAINALDGQPCAYFSQFSSGTTLQRRFSITNDKTRFFSLKPGSINYDIAYGWKFDHFVFDDFFYFHEFDSPEYKATLDFIKIIKNPECPSSLVIFV